MIGFAKHLLHSICALAFVLFIAATLLITPGCGGGTTGTGGTGSSEFSGRIVSQNGLPVAGANVVLAETGDTAVSDPNGQFALESVLPGTSATLLVETASAQASATITDIPSGANDVTVELKLDETKNTVTIQSQQIAPAKKRKPTRTPTPLPIAEPTPALEPTATVVPTVIPLETPTITPTVESTPTVIPTETLIPLPIETPEPSLPDKTAFRGLISGDAALLQRLRIGLAGSENYVRVKPNGAFTFKTTVISDKPQLEVIAGKQSALVSLDFVTPASVRVNLQLTITANEKGIVSVSVDTLKVID